MIDTGAASGSKSGKMRYMAYCAATGRTSAINNTRSAICHFGIGFTESLDIATVKFLVWLLWRNFELQVLDTDISMLLSKMDMDRLGIYLNNLKNRLVHASSGEFSKVTRIRDRPFLGWIEPI